MLNTKALGAAYSGPTVLPPGYANYYPSSLPQSPLSNVMDWSSGFLLGVCFGNNEWVVVGQSGYIATAVSDLSSGTRKTSGTTRHLDGIVWGSLSNISTKNLKRVVGSTSGKFFGVGQDGVVFASDGGLIWSWWMQATPVGLSAVRHLGAVAGHESKIVASGDYADIYVEKPKEL